MSHHHHSHVLCRQLPHGLQHLTGKLRVQGRGRLVKEHDIRLHAEGSGNGHTLLLTAGKLAWVVVFPVAEAHLGKELAGIGQDFGLLHSLHMHRRLNEVLHHCHVGEKVELLEHHAHAGKHLFLLPAFHVFGLAFFIGSHQRSALHLDGAGVNSLQLVQAAQQSGFAGA